MTFDQIAEAIVDRIIREAERDAELYLALEAGDTIPPHIRHDWTKIARQVIESGLATVHDATVELTVAAAVAQPMEQP
jgi:hypothetical protein